MRRLIPHAIRHLALALALAFVAANPASALKIYFNPSDGMDPGWGIHLEHSSVDLAPGENLVDVADDMGRLIGPTPYFIDPMEMLFSFVTPNPIPGSTVSSPSYTNPNEGEGGWTLTVADLVADEKLSLLEDLWVVFTAHSTNDPHFPFYDSENVGLDIDLGGKWALFQPDPMGFPDIYYVGYFLGTLAPGDSVEIPLSYRVAQDLFFDGGDYVFPQYDIMFTNAMGPVPEPALAILLGAGGIALAARRRRS